MGRRLPLSASLYYRHGELPEVGLHQRPSEKKGQTAPGRARHVAQLFAGRVAFAIWSFGGSFPEKIQA